MANLTWQKIDELKYIAKTPEGIYRIAPTGNGLWRIKTPFGMRPKAEETLSDAKKIAAQIRINHMRYTPKGHFQ